MTELEIRQEFFFLIKFLTTHKKINILTHSDSTKMKDKRLKKTQIKYTLGCGRRP